MGISFLALLIYYACFLGRFVIHLLFCCCCFLRRLEDSKTGEIRLYIGVINVKKTVFDDLSLYHHMSECNPKILVNQFYAEQ